MTTAETDDAAGGDGAANSTEERAAEGVEHLQRAARELIRAARAFLDVAEDVIDDPDRVRVAAEQVTRLKRITLD